jgi:hypothetical protein
LTTIDVWASVSMNVDFMKAGVDRLPELLRDVGPRRART